MTERNYDKLERMREEIRRDHERIAMLQEQVRAKEAKLREAEGSRIVADVEAMKLSPEQIGSLLDLIASGQIQVNGEAISAPVPKTGRRNTPSLTYEESNDETKETEIMKEDSDDEE